MNQQPYQPPNQPPQQPQQGQYQQYPGGPPFGGPGFPQKPQRPGWVIPLVIVAVVAVVLCGVLGGILIGQRLVLDSGSVEQVSASSAIAETKATPEPAPTEAPTPEPAPTEAPTPEPAPTQKPEHTWISVGECLDDAIDWIEDSPNYVENYTFEPLGCVDDFDGDGNQDFLAEYETKAANGAWCVSYALFTLTADGPKLLDDGILYQEVGGNGGSVGIAKGKDGAVYLTRFVKQPNGENMNNQYAYIPWNSVGTADEANSFSLEASWTVGEEESGSYTFDGSKVDRDKFEKSRGNYTMLYELNIAVGHGSGEAGGADFDTLEKWYDD